MKGPDMHQLAALPNISHARLPVIYEQAKTALIECAQIDECAKWANKADALASYAKQAEDSSLRKMADRIQARAIRRCGKLLKEIKPAKGGDRKSKGGCPPVDSRKAAAKKAGMSEHQTKQAIRVAGIPEEDFEAAVESDTPPTVTELAERGSSSKCSIWRAGAQTTSRPRRRAMAPSADSRTVPPEYQRCRSCAARSQTNDHTSESRPRPASRGSHNSFTTWRNRHDETARTDRREKASSANDASQKFTR
jgi:hypothetical protein